MPEMHGEFWLGSRFNFITFKLAKISYKIGISEFTKKYLLKFRGWVIGNILLFIILQSYNLSQYIISYYVVVDVVIRLPYMFIITYIFILLVK